VLINSDNSWNKYKVWIILFVCGQQT